MFVLNVTTLGNNNNCVRKMFKFTGSRVLPVCRSSLRHYSTRKRIVEESRKQVESDRAKLRWRQDYLERGEWYSKLRLFANENEDMDVMTSLQQPRDVSVKGVKDWFQERRDKMEQSMQAYIPERNEILGKDLAAAHFVVYRGAKVRFVGHTEWAKLDEDDEYDLPRFYDEKYKVEAIDFEGMDLFYEGLENTRMLQSLTHMSFRNVARFDDWCLDRVSGSDLTALNTLNLAGTKVTALGLGALYRVPSLRTLILDASLRADKVVELTTFMLQDIIPDLKVIFADPVEQQQEKKNGQD